MSRRSRAAVPAPSKQREPRGYRLLGWNLWLVFALAVGGLILERPVLVIVAGGWLTASFITAEVILHPKVGLKTRRNHLFLYLGAMGGMALLCFMAWVHL